ncbi:uncharacterized protein LOC133904333 [Phragmites australis]|uniref:uncharacterized protein LOC133904333 n=1 Tax=Phragmites australis TaxID=29695 RepID=UPI002D789A26|nr:uncharacterized protein LOC133904333 [Phragmites australis]
MVDWDMLQIEEKQDEEGRIQIITDDQLYLLLGLRDEDEKAEEARQNAAKASAEGVSVVDGTHGAAIPIDDAIPEERVMVHDKNNPCMDLGSKYPNMKEFRLAMRQFAMNKEFELGIEKTDPSRYRGYCKGDGCCWRIVGRVQSDNKTIMVTVVMDGHTCTSSSRRKTTTPTSAWVADKAIPILRKSPNMGAKELQSRLQDDHKCTIAYDTVWKGKEKALQELYGSWEESFQQLYNWKVEVLKRSPSSVIEIDTKEVDGRVYFHRFFCALGPCIEGFLGGCRPYLSIDSTALSGRWNGHLASACGLDGHNWMYPLAFGFMVSETEDNWTWFMRQLHKAIGDLPLLAICTDACKRLENAVKEVFPRVEQRECFRHLMQNFIKRFSGDTFQQMHHSLLWMRCAFNPAIKCDYVTNNLAKCFNNWISDIKDLPVTELVDKLREMIMILWEKRRRIGERLHGKILPAILHQLKARTRGLGHLTVVKADSNAAQVWDNSNKQARHVVKSHEHECTCLEWQHTGKPCQHALAFITTQQARNVKMENFVDDYYSLEKFKEVYKRLIEPLPDKSQWPNVELPFELGAPLAKSWKTKKKEDQRLP